MSFCVTVRADDLPVPLRSLGLRPHLLPARVHVFGRTEDDSDYDKPREKTFSDVGPSAQFVQVRQCHHEDGEQEQKGVLLR